MTWHKEVHTVLEASKEPRSPVDRTRALEHAQLTVRRAWAGDAPDFAPFATTEINPEPLVVHDLNGQVLFYVFDAMQRNRVVGSIRAAASRIVGPAVMAVELGARKWDASRATQQAQAAAKRRFPKATVTATELVCYSYPKIGVRVALEIDGRAAPSVIFDVSSLAPVERFGDDEPEGMAAWSYYHRIAEPRADERERIWNLADAELEATRTVTPRIFARAFTARELVQIKPSLIVDSPNIAIPFYSSKVLKFGPRCAPHDCFELYSQQTDVYCAVATAQMILDFYRWNYTQDQIAAAMSTDATGTTNPNQVAGYESLSRQCLDATFDGSADWAEAKAEIDANRPLKSGIPGHARACAGWQRQNLFLISKEPRRWLRIYDPWPWNANICEGGAIVWEDWDTVDHTNFIYVRHRTTTHS
jgi:hypothetical protein